MIDDEFVESLKPFVDFLTVCPEVEIGLGVPREPIRIVSLKKDLHLIQPATKRDVTREMREFSNTFLARLKEIDGFILKSRSPSCGIRDVKIYPDAEKNSALGRGVGFFGGAVFEHYPSNPVEDEGRLENWRIRERFLTTIFALARLRAASRGLEIGNLVQFHTQHKLLLVANSRNEMRILGKIVANHVKRSAVDLFTLYRNHLLQALSKPSRFTSNINVLMHAIGYFKDKLNPKEKRHFLNSLGKYRDSKLPLSALLAIVNSWIARFHECVSLRPKAPWGDTGVSERNERNLSLRDTDMESQIYFKPYPEGLFETTDSLKGRDSRSNS